MGNGELRDDSAEAEQFLTPYSQSTRTVTLAASASLLLPQRLSLRPQIHRLILFNDLTYFRANVSQTSMPFAISRHIPLG